MNDVKQCSILVVDDTEENIDILSDLLGDDYDVSVAMNGKDALHDIAKNPPDLILLDIMMPEIDGYEVCRRVKADPVTKEIPIIFISAMSEEIDEAKGLELGAIDYITKPISPSIVKSRIKNHLELQLARKELKQQNEILKDNIRLREEMEQIARHDLKTPLNALINIPGIMIKEGNLTPNQQEMLQMMEESGYRMLEIVNSSLDLLKMEKGNYKPNLVPVNILNLIQQIRGETLELFNTKGLSFNITLDEQPFSEDQTFMVAGEEMLCYSMLANLIKNAIEASPENEPIQIVLKNGDRQLIKIENKSAVPQQIKDKFFEKYSTFGKKDGTGLGTYSAKLIAETLKGEISFETSDKEDRTTLIIYLKFPSSTIASSKSSLPSSTSKSSNTSDLSTPTEFNKNIRVLIADDYGTMRYTIISLLNQMGLINCIEAADGLQALKKIQSQQIDLIISDLNMPFQSGLEILKYVRSDERLKHIPFIMVTGESDKKAVIQAAKMGVTAFIVKPFSPDVLRKKIESLLQ
ncbi:MAG: response regulator [Desulfamplus sp.]|nr:response regulator [Desulfamplus sp.]